MLVFNNSCKNYLKHSLTNTKPVILSLSGASLTDDEEAFFHDFNPLGFILFHRNIDNKEQVKSLITELKNSLPETRKWVPILIDEEGGVVDRLTNIHHRDYPTPLSFGMMAKMEGLDKAKDAVFTNSNNIGILLNELGFNVNCAPVADLYDDNERTRTNGEKNPAISNRSFSDNPKIVAELSKSFIDGMKSNRIIPIIKHIPGHGLTTVDSHHTLPIISNSLNDLEQNDFKVFKELNNSPWSMVSHIIYSAIDANLPASQSKIVVDYIRKQLDFKGILITDGLEMNALTGNIGSRAVNALNSGIDLGLYCKGKLEEMQDIELAFDENNIDRLQDQTIERIIKSLEYIYNCNQNTIT